MDFESYKKLFQENGYVLIKNFFSENEANIIKYSADEMEKWKEEPGKWMIFFEKAQKNKKKTRLENFINYHNNIKLILEKKVKNAVEKIFNKKTYIFKDKLNWKHSEGKGFKAHQDHPAWTDFEPNIYVTAAAFANNSTVENGCLYFGKGNTKFVSECPNNKEGSGEIKKDIEDSLNWQVTETTTRDLLIFDSFVPHKSYENKTNNSRRIFYFTFNDAKYGNLYQEYLKKKRENFPPDIERKNNVNKYNNKYNLANPID